MSLTTVEGIQPISGTGLNLPSYQKGLQTNGNGTSNGDGKQYRAPVGKKVTARPPSTLLPDNQTPNAKPESGYPDDKDQIKKPTEEDPQNSLFNQVYEWLQREKTKQKTRNFRPSSLSQTDGAVSDGDDDYDDYGTPLDPTTSQGSDSPVALDKLEKILLQYATSRYEDGVAGVQPRRPRRRHVKGLRRGSASESDYLDPEAAAPSVDAALDNSKTLAYTGGAADEDDEEGVNKARAKDRENWLVFKSEILRLAHTMRLKGWRKVPMDIAGDVEVVRLSGALTNAVYVVTPPKNIPIPKAEDGSYTLVPRKPPPKLLLRIYGPQVDHLIDRENELQILRRLGRKNIGPRVLGTFNNGRFEEFFEARTLTPKDLRIPDTSKQIAKRMRELHEGIDLLEHEREGGPMVFKNWDKWVDRCEQVINWLDKEIQSSHNETKAQSEPWRRRGFVCGVPWPLFRKAVDNYRQWLVNTNGGMQEIKRQLVFAHNDTQYGNLLRMEPSGESPLLLPANEHKQLVVIDFEYASANTPGFEFANHFSEWCYNYHDAERSWACNNKWYPRPEEQHRFISSYLNHRPNFGSRSATSPSSTPTVRGASNIASLPPLDLDDSNPQAPSMNEVEKSHEDSHEAAVQYLMKQTRLWRVSNSAQWVAWGIVQAKVPGMEEGIAADAAKANGEDHDATNPSSPEIAPSSPVDADAEEEDFDYLAYAQDRALFFWSDILSLNLIKEDELPPAMVEHIKSRIIEY
ncbi:hypothetical protein ASPWEDRAFT_171667 [Aspergillus wentii DTO 134E9]|uniref:Choline kinase N-terminal domain-containing protein n=1 Tax=Aspergillus wentii DTO 134E9 TaxID=1073089 RepID=A0A1L9RIV8_ASPWE|nr:uncharacterized protein ASPWEDRAFT_171667 [Aspergillus wentii DTO 134E9]OJJ34831.1 hypothetical protein ASPWEDRAFT_171667 [Aspergillus wentii DTO 134E9]